MILALTMGLFGCDGGGELDAGASDAGPAADAGGALDDAGPPEVDAGAAPLPAPWSAGPPMPHVVDHHVTWIHSVDAGTFLYVIGGMRADASGQPEEIYDTVHRARIAADGSLEDWEALAPLPVPLAFHAIAYHPLGFLVLIGGLSANDDGRPAINPYALAARIREDGTFGEWGGDDIVGAPTLHGTAVTIGDRVYVAGGGSGAVGFNTAVWSFTIDMEGDSYALSMPRWEAALPAPRSHHTAYLHGDDLFILGGMTEGGGDDTAILAATWDADAIVGWEVRGHLPTPPITAAGFVRGDSLFYVGGLSRAGALSAIGRVDLDATGQATPGAALLDLPEARGHVHQTPVHEGVLYTVGGRAIRAAGQTSIDNVAYATLPE